MARLMQDWRAEENNPTPDVTKVEATLEDRNESPYLLFAAPVSGNDPVYAHFKGMTLPDYDFTLNPEARLVWFADDPVSGVVNDVVWEVSLHRIADGCVDQIDVDHTFIYAQTAEAPCLFGEGLRKYTEIDLSATGVNDNLNRGEFFELEVRRVIDTGATGTDLDVGLQFVQLVEQDR